MLRLQISFLLVFASLCQAQHKYDVQVKWNTPESALAITQTIQWTNTSNVAVDAIYLLDWNHAYASEWSPLGRFLANEYDYKLIRANKNKRGYTSINTISANQNVLNWSRDPEKRDVIKVALDRKVAPAASVVFTIDYTVQLPNARIFTYGKDKEGIFSHHWHLVLAAIANDGSWTLDSNLGFDKPTSPLAETTYDIKLPSDYELILPHSETRGLSPLIATKNKQIQQVSFGETTLLTDMLQQNDTQLSSDRLVAIQTFLKQHFPDLNPNTIWAFKKDYKQNTLLALESLPEILKAFDKNHVLELKLLKALLHWYIPRKYSATSNEAHWALEGLPDYLWYQYVQEHFPNLLMTGNLRELPFMKNYHFAQAPYHRSWELAVNVSTNKNRGQALTTPKEKLTRYNRKIANPNRATLALMYLDDYIGGVRVATVLKSLTGGQISHSSLKKALQKHTNKPLDWFFDYYVKEDNNTDFKVAGKKIDAEFTKINITSSKPNSAIPLKKIFSNGEQQTEWLLPSDLPYIKDYKNSNIASLTVNENHLVPEELLNNNSYHLGNGIFRNNLKLRLLQDIPKSGTALLLYRPEFAYNFYDGLLTGLSLGNSSILGNTFRFQFSPQFGLKSQQISGLGYIITNLYNETRANYLTQITLFGSSYHYASNLRYTAFTPSIEFFYRPKGIQNKERSSLLFRHVSIRLDDLPEDDNRRSYGVSLASFQSRSGDALRNISYKVESQLAHNFKKISASSEYISYYGHNRRWTFRAFAGSFLSNNSEDNYFDFNASRVNDYLFQYDLYGRSEREGFFSQQYIRAEGGLRTTGRLTSANQWLITAQSSTTLWRWIEAYAEIGWIKSKLQNPETHWGTGITFNLIPDFFEVHFPIYNASGAVVSNNAYPKYIRFQLSLRPAALVSLLSRSWF